MFQVTDVPDPDAELSYCTVEGGWGPSDARAFAGGRFQGLELLLKGRRLKNLDFVTDLPGLLGLAVLGSVKDDGAAFRVGNLISLGLMTRSQTPLNFGASTGIRALKIDNRPGLEEVARLTRLESLHIYQLTATTLDFLGEKPNLTSLQLDCADQDLTLERVAGAAKLMLLEVRYASVADLEPIRSIRGLKYLAIVRPRRVEPKGVLNLEFLADCPQLEWLRLTGWRSIQSLAPLRWLPQLNGVGFGSTEIVDGDMTPLFDLPAGVDVPTFRHRPHYSHTYDEIVAFRAARDSKY